MSLKKYGLIGNPLEHSFSPEIHSLLGDYEYSLCPIEKNELRSFFKKTELSGFNVTIPYKTDVIEFCSEVSDIAGRIGSVNTVIRRDDNTFYGDNTDYFGFMTLLGSDAESLRGKKAVILGSGGASKSAYAVLCDLGVNPIIIVSRSGKDNYNNISKHYDAQLVVNTTPVGMYPNNGEAVIDIKDFTNCSLVLDMIYNPAKTKLILDCERLGIKCRSGLLMLVAQAEKSSELFTGTALPDSIISQITSTLYTGMKNIILIGMPGCGKTTIGKLFSEETGRAFYDTDDLICKAAGMSIPDIFKEYGEAHFRKLETEVLKEVSKKSGAVISTGGGIVKAPENEDLLRQNSTVILLEADLKKLSSEGRPLSQAKDIMTLYNERQPIYEKLCEYRIKNDTTPSEVVKGITASVKL